mgnify:CR=1 FL=1|jgi:hypothetical protein|tara:strand:+ start:490 stop:885 length:396 start_codon:yes stop_codon:yes gene_type:complete
MAFSDAELAGAMSVNLVAANVMTIEERELLLEDPTENKVRETLTADQLANFPAYWDLLGAWMDDHGGNIATTTGTNVPGRDGGNPTNIGTKAIYNDAFRDVNQYIGTPGFLPVKAVSNQLRFVSVLGEDDE